MRIPKECRLEKVADKGESRYAFNSLRLERDENGVTAVASDGRILAAISLDSEGWESQDADVLIPVDAWKASKGGELTVNGKAESRGKSGMTIHDLRDGKYPDWRQVIPSEAGVKVRLNSKLLRNLLEGLGSDHVVLTVIDPGYPVVVRGMEEGETGPPSDERLGLIMPILQ